MTQPFAAQQPQVKVRTALLLMIKGAQQPIALYFANPQKEYEDLKNAMKTPNVLIEKDSIGPIKKFCIVSNNILGVILQDEQYQ